VHDGLSAPTRPKSGDAGEACIKNAAQVVTLLAAL
jgi:hypothetical protein